MEVRDGACYPFAMRNLSSTWGVILLFVFCTGCVSVVDPDVGGRAETGSSTGGMVLTGSSRVAPPDWRQPQDIDERPLGALPVSDHPSLPLDRLARLKPWMTEAELIELLGPPELERIAVQGIDSDGRDWNARLLIWRFQDDRWTSLELTRDLEVRMAKVPTRRPLPPRPEVVGPAWVMVDWTLF